MQKKLILILFKGGMGNQLFQLAAATHVLSVQGGELKYSNLLMPKRPDSFRGVSRWPLEIGPLVKFLDEVRLGAQPPGKTSLKSKFVTAMFLIAELFNRIQPWVYLASDETVEQVLRSRTSHRLIILNGVFAKGACVTGSLNQLKTDFAKYRAATSMLSGTNDLAVHVRLGDHVRLEPSQLKKRRAFLERAFEHYGPDSVGRIALFSDEPDVALTLFPEGLISRCDIIDLEISPAETLALISTHRRIVASPSTFSWWASALQSDGETLMPQEYREELRKSGLILPHLTFI